MSRRAKFTVAREPIELELGGDVFNAPPIIPAAVLGDMVDAGERISEIQNTNGLTQKEQLEQVMKVVDDVFGLVLVPDSASLFHERLYSRTNPFDLMREVMPAMEWLVEEYTNRPTEPSPPSPIGSSDGTSSSTSGASVAGSTPTPSQLTAGATPSMPPSTT